MMCLECMKSWNLEQDPTCICKQESLLIIRNVLIIIACAIGLAYIVTILS